MAVALLPPQQQHRNWFFIDLDDGGVYEVEVDMVGGHESQPGLCVFIAETHTHWLLVSTYAGQVGLCNIFKDPCNLDQAKV